MFLSCQRKSSSSPVSSFPQPLNSNIPHTFLIMEISEMDLNETYGIVRYCGQSDYRLRMWKMFKKYQSLLLHIKFPLYNFTLFYKNAYKNTRFKSEHPKNV